jgi:ABC-type transport system involved in multi-copper enzyme maturation permease subunit
MAVYEQSYQPWSGRFTGRARRVWAMVRPGLAQPFGNLWILLVVLFAWVLVAVWLLILLMVAQAAARSDEAAALTKVAFALGNNIYREQFFNNPFFSMILMVLSVAAGAGLVARDFRSRALLLYFSGAITRADYVAGKFLTLAIFLLSVTLGPALLLFLGQWAMGTERLTAGDRLRDLLAITLHSLILVVPMSAAVLACSALTRRAYVAGILWAGFFFASQAMSQILSQTLDEEWCRLLSWTNLTAHLGNLCYATREIKAGLFTGPPARALAYGWAEPLAILSGLTVVSLGIVCWRVRRVDAAE